MSVLGKTRKSQFHMATADVRWVKTQRASKALGGIRGCMVVVCGGARYGGD